MNAYVLSSSVVVPPAEATVQSIRCFGDPSHTHRIALVKEDPRHDPAVLPTLARKIDRFSALSLTGTAPLLGMLEGYEPSRIGIFVGNMLGGWAYGETQLDNLVKRGPRSVHPYQATAWFPAAAQGEVSIQFGLTGFSKTVSGGYLCGIEALLVALDALATGRVDYAVAGAAESPVSSFGLWGLASGCPPEEIEFGEGAAFLLLARDAASTNPRIEVTPLEFQPKTGDWYSMFIENMLSPPSRPIRIPSVDPVLDVLEVLRWVKPSQQVRLTQRTATGQGFSVELEGTVRLNNGGV